MELEAFSYCGSHDLRVNLGMNAIEPPPEPLRLP